MSALQHSLGMAQDRPSSTMSSRKLLALDFIKRYFAQWGHSPTLGEIASALGGISTKRAHDLVHQLAIDKMIEHVSGKARGIRLLDRGEELSEADVLLRLSALGWRIGVDGKVLESPLTEKELPLLPLLDHDPTLEDEVGTSGTTEQPDTAEEGPGHAQRRSARDGRSPRSKSPGLGKKAS